MLNIEGTIALVFFRAGGVTKETGKSAFGEHNQLLWTAGSFDIYRETAIQSHGEPQEPDDVRETHEVGDKIITKTDEHLHSCGNFEALNHTNYI